MINIKDIVQAAREGQIKFYIEGNSLMVKECMTGRELPIGTERREFRQENLCNSYSPLIFKDGICPKCGGGTHGYGDGPMECEDCGWRSNQNTPYSTATASTLIK